MDDVFKLAVSEGFAAQHNDKGLASVGINVRAALSKPVNILCSGGCGGI